jgi:hypothetical protein
MDRDKARAGKRLTEWFGAFYGRAKMAEEVSVWGSAAECADGLVKVAAALARRDVSDPSPFSPMNRSC